MTETVVVIGAGVGGLTAALDLASRGIPVIVIEKESRPGGKMRQVSPAGRPVDAGPTVFTLRRIFDELFDQAGTSLEAEIAITKLEVLARHAWDGGGTDNASRLDLFADVKASAAAIGAFAGKAEADGFLRFNREASRIFNTLYEPFMRAQRPSPMGLAMNAGVANIGNLLATNPFRTMWSALGAYFADPRLRQLFGRYTTYCGSSPFQAPGTFMLVAHAEQEGVWTLAGGMHALAATLQRLAEAQGAAFRFGAGVERILTGGGRVTGVRLADGGEIRARSIILNADVSALGVGLLGNAVRSAAALTPPARRSLSALTWCLDTRTEGFPLTRHNVFFSKDYPAEFTAIFDQRRLPHDPTVYVCAQDRGDDGIASGPDRLLCLVNAPADGDRDAPSDAAITACGARAFALMQRCGLTIDRSTPGAIVTGPREFNALFPASGGALYGPASHGWMASFEREGARTKIPGLYLAGGSVHPAPGVPMAAISGRLAVAALLADRR
ncbi:MAG: phytoene desaturase [Methylocystis sp.]|nr:phytoene desaturase [Methylocystis sp.]MCA3584428.1 phytoene desaturase [Methylocystis sp.]MCA3587209.1 phytoene desaturase [Methylocystis sp.]MCA3592551.1 phytoene desaturase [Methylocystis sp.]